MTDTTRAAGTSLPEFVAKAIAALSMALPQAPPAYRRVLSDVPPGSSPPPFIGSYETPAIFVPGLERRASSDAANCRAPIAYGCRWGTESRQ